MEKNIEKPIRILCVFSELDRAGAETMCMNLYRRINRAKIQFDFVKHTQERGAYEEEILKLGGRIFVAPRYKIYNQKKYCKWWENHLRTHPEHTIIHGHFYTISALYFKIAKRMGRITIAHSHSTSVSSRGVKKILSEFLVSKIGKYSDIRLACSKAAGKWMYKDKSFAVIHNAIDSERYAYNPKIRTIVREKWGLQRSIVIGTVGRITYPKNPIGLLRIFSEIKKKIPNAVLFWVGDGDCRPEVERLIAESGLTKDIILLGNRDDVPALLQAMDVFVLPSRFEGLGMAAVEAQAAGLPCLLSDTIPHDVQLTDLCHFLPLSQPKQWVNEVAKKQDVRTNRSGEIVAAGYDIRTTVNWMENLYEWLSANVQ